MLLPSLFPTKERRVQDMKILKKKSAPRYVREQGITSYLLASQRTCDAQYLTTSVVEIKAGGEQRIHHHIPLSRFTTYSREMDL